MHTSHLTICWKNKTHHSLISPCLSCAVLCFTLCKVNEKNAWNQKRQGSAIWIADVLGWSLGCLVMLGESQHLHRFPECHKPRGGARLHGSHTQSTEDWKQQALALLCFGNSPLWSHQHLKTREMTGSRAESSPALHPLHTGTQPPGGLGRGQSNLSTSFVLRVWQVTHPIYSTTWTHRSRMSELLSRMFTLLPSWMLPKSYQKTSISCSCGCSTESERPGKTSALQKNFSHPEHRDPSLSVFISCFVLLKARGFSAAAELPELGLVRIFSPPFWGEVEQSIFHSCQMYICKTLAFIRQKS